MALHLMRRSNVFILMALHHVCPKWHRDLPLSKVVSVVLKTKRIAAAPYSVLDYRRVYIEKASGG